MTAAEYRDQLLQLLPPGVALPKESGAVFVDLISGIAEELARIDDRGDQIIEESDPRTTDELLAEWLTMFGVPDDCSILNTAPSSDRIQLLQKITAQAGQTPEFYVQLGEAATYSSRLAEYREFMCDLNSAGDPLYDSQWKHAFTLYIDEPPVVARAGIARAGDALSTFDASWLDCLLQNAKPAHTVAFVGFE